MSSQDQGRQSPSPESSSNKQTATSSSGQGINEKPQSKEESKTQLEGLTSNPKGAMEDHLAEQFKKTEEQKK